MVEIRMKRRQALTGVAGLAAGAMLPRIGRAGTPLNVGALRFTSHAASFVAFERGYFADEGLDVTFRFFEAAQPMAVAIASGDADFSVTSVTGGLVSLAQKGAVKVIGGALQEEKGIDGQMILASEAAYADGLTSPGDLAGRTFGITTAGSSFHYMAAKIAEREGIADLRLKPLQKVPAIIGALKSGQIDAWSIVPHIGKPLVESGAVRHIGMVADFIPDYQVTTVFTSTANAVDDRPRTEAFLRAFSRGADDFDAALVDRTLGEDKATEMVELIHKYVYADKPYEEAEKSIRDGAMRINRDAALNVTSVGDQLGWFKSKGLVDEDVGMDTLVDSSYVRTF